MRKLYYIMGLLVLQSITSCDSKKERVEKSYYEDGTLKSAVEMVGDKRHGEYRAYSKTGKLLMVAEFQDDKQHGWTHSFYENGQKEYESEFVEGKPVGFTVAFYPSGDTLSFYDKGRAIRFFENGKIEQITCSQNEDLNSIRSIRFDLAGKILMREEPLYCLTRRDSVQLDGQYPTWRTGAVVNTATE